jgi:ribulose-phosphate 3-epimerase
MTAACIAPSLLAADLLHLGDEVAAVEQAGAERLHVDVMDGRFVPNISFGVPVLRALRRATTRRLDVHLMIEQPERYLEDFVEAGASSLLVHQEQAPHLHRTLARIRELGARPGVVLNPATPPSALSEVLPMVDMVLVMTVDPGFGGQAMIAGSERKVREVAAMTAAMTVASPAVEVAVDGGVDVDTAPGLVAAGARVLVAGSAVFGAAGGPGPGLRQLAAAVTASELEREARAGAGSRGEAPETGTAERSNR